MAFKFNRSRNEPMSEINVTPFVDVMLVLLIIFMVTAPLLTVGVQVDLPESAADSLPDEKKEKKQIVKKKQNPEEIEPQIRQSSEFEKKEIVDTNQIAALIDKAKEEEAVKKNKTDKLTQSSVKNSFATGLTLSEEDALRAQIFGCWSVPLGLPYDEDLLVRIKLQLKKDGTIMKSEILDHERMNRPGQKFYKVLAESALRAVRLCQPLKVPPTGYDKWKDLQLNFNPAEMLRG